MANSVYEINKGINKSIEFKGLKAQYIWYLGIGILILLLVFGFLYVLGINQIICVVIIGGLGAVLFQKVYAMSNKYGEHGMMKRFAQRSVPKVVKSNSRKRFVKMKGGKYGKDTANLRN
ncbi:DUF4133 domain-containing protein [Taibaiella chishuiensis]|uniref:Uncharacterized protein DUF4133 n=1 Tax=Taibaiella chishuiensis TaxID=1434707 RepID=A0A2P8D0V5_9BACT|nr:DUF4133 domain-containing protein [Taibaiella chishuiensis]PSK90786.1 uncharacterized protein DUF4133 [Taibaiella chishuiensis]